MSKMTDDEQIGIVDGTREAMYSLLQVKHDLSKSTAELSQHIDAARRHIEVAQNIISRAEEVTGKLSLATPSKPDYCNDDCLHSCGPSCFKKKLLACSALSCVLLVSFKMGILLGADSNPRQNFSRKKTASAEFLATALENVRPSNLSEEETFSAKLPQNNKELDSPKKTTLFSTGDNKLVNVVKGNDWLVEPSMYPPGPRSMLSAQGNNSGFEKYPPKRVNSGTSSSFLLRGAVTSVHRKAFGFSSSQKIGQRRVDITDRNKNLGRVRSQYASKIVLKDFEMTSSNSPTTMDISRAATTYRTSLPEKRSIAAHGSISHKENAATSFRGKLINVVPTPDVRRQRTLGVVDCDAGYVRRIVNISILVYGIHDEFIWALYNMSGSVVTRHDPVRVARQDGDSLPWYNFTSSFCYACHDQDERCSAWAKDSQCKTNPSHTLPNCARSCNACECFTFELASASQSVLHGEYEVTIEGLTRKHGTWRGYKLTRIGKSCEAREQVRCGEKPILSQDSEFTLDFSDPDKERVHNILHVVASISGRNALVDVNSAQYKAACWIIYDDALAVSPKSITFVQRYVLAVLFFATNGDRWEMAYDFLSPRPECTWNWLAARYIVDWGGTDNELWQNYKEEWRTAGVSCNNSSKVERIMMGGNNLEGTIVSELSKLSSLELLALSNNNLQGFIPTELGALSNLSHLLLPMNNLQGSLPGELFHLEKLVELSVQQNNITGSLPSHTGNLTKLKILRASDNALEGHIPPSLYDLHNLMELQLGNNSFSGTISGSIRQLSSLTYCDLSTNDLTGSIVPQIGELRRLERLYLTGNNLTFDIPVEINNLSNIAELDFSQNHLTGHIPADLSDLKKLKGLHLSENALSGPIPATVGALSMISTIELHNNALSGLIPSSLAMLTNLEMLRLERNRLRGEIPGELCSNFAKMQGNQSDHVENWQLYYSADCDGHFDAKAVSCPCCTFCCGPSLFRSRVGPCPDGSVEASLFFQNVYESFGIRWELENGFGYDVLQGGPYSWTMSRNVHRACIASTDCYEFRLYPGKYSSSVFHQISHEGKLIDASRSNAVMFGYSSVSKTLSKDRCDPIMVCGKVEVGGLNRSVRRAMFDTLVLYSGLEMLSDSDSAQHKAACWTIDDDFWNLDATHEFFLQRYVLALLHFKTKAWAAQSQKQEPPSSDECHWCGITCNQDGYVSEIDLSQKSLKGSLPRELGEISSLEALHLGMNQLHGSLPIELSNLWRLQRLELGGNSLQGPIPSQLGQISNLTVLDLSGNELSGTLPSELFHLSRLDVLNVSGNNLHGSIAPKVLSLSNLVHLDCSANFFTGSIPSEINIATKLEHLDLSRNEITGKISLGGLWSSNLRHVYLHTNRLSGTLAPALFQGSKLETIMLQNNDLTGSIPETLGESSYLSSVVLSYNSFKGGVPNTLKNLENLQILHLHGNHLTGSIDRLHRLDSFITDCGSPSSTAASKIVCESCTECCNSDGQCQQHRPHMLSELQMGLLVTAMLFAAVIGLSFTGMLCVKRKLVLLPVIDSSAQILCGEESTYSLVLASSFGGWIISAVTVFLQGMMFGVFLLAADFDASASDWEYTMRCPPNSLECENDDGKTPFGWAIFAILVALSLVPEIADGFRLIYESVSLVNFRCLIGGTILVCITALAVLTSIVYNQAIAQTNTALITNAVILLFVNDMDEMFFAVLKNLFPNWVQNRVDEAEDYSVGLLTSNMTLNSTLYDYGFTSNQREIKKVECDSVKFKSTMGLSKILSRIVSILV